MYWYFTFLVVVGLAFKYRLAIRSELLKIVEYVIVRVMREPLALSMVGLMANLTQTQSRVTVNVESKSKWIKFKLDDINYAIPLPFDRKKKETTVVYEMRDGEKKEYVYPRGVPFFCSPDDLRCKSITTIIDDVEVVYEGGDIPLL